MKSLTSLDWFMLEYPLVIRLNGSQWPVNAPISVPEGLQQLL